MLSQIAVVIEFLLLVRLQLCVDKSEQFEYYALALIT